ncbi:MAG: methylated-DNA--[protein]-cysteine S-methyltransferase [Acidimicrobiia bacterium]
MAAIATCKVWMQQTPIGTISVLSGPNGLRRIALPGDDLGPVPDGTVDARDPRIAKQLEEYFSGRRHTFDLTLDLSDVHGAFSRRALEALQRDVPWGETISYGELAELAGSPRGGRAAGQAMRRNPIPIVIPCHRVIQSSGALGGYAGRAQWDRIKIQLLAHEGSDGFALSDANRLSAAG